MTRSTQLLRASSANGLGQQQCLQVVAQMVNPETGATRTASDSCQINDLKARGWVRARNHAGDDPNGEPASAGISTGLLYAGGALASAGLIWAFSA